MSFLGTKAQARADIASVQVDTGSIGSGATSPILNGASSPGGAANGHVPSNETQQVGRLRKGIKTPKTRTGELTRLYAATPR